MSFAVPRVGRTTFAAIAASTALSALALTPTAEAAFSLAPCTGSDIAGRGATFQANAHTVWNTKFTTTTSAGTCNGGPKITYNPAGTPNGSGAGRAAMGSGETNSLGLAVGQRDPAVRFAGSDEGPNGAQQSSMEAGVAGAADDGRMHVIPAAASAVAVVVNYPTWDNDPGAADTQVSCPLPSDAANIQPAVAGGFARLRLTNKQLEALWAGKTSTWGQLLPSIDDDAAADDANPAGFLAGCVDRKIIRVVRNDNSGTTFAFKDYLQEAVTSIGASSSGTPWRNLYTPDSASNRKWPETDADDDVSNAGTRGSSTDYNIRFTGSQELDATYGDIADTNNKCEDAYLATPAVDTPVCRSRESGAGGVRSVVNANTGSIGYIDLSSAVSGDVFKMDTAADRTYVLPLEVRSTGNYVEPTVNALGYKKGTATEGANCATVPVRKLPTGDDPTVRYGWESTSMVYPAAGYAACTLTYILAFDDNAPVYLNMTGTTYAEEERKARTLKDYLSFVVSPAGQTELVGRDYAPLPADALAAAKVGVDAIGWDKQNLGNQNQTPPPPAPPAPGPGTTGPTPQNPVVQPPAKQAPVNLFTIGSARKRANDLVGTFRLPGAGALQVTASGTYTEKVKAKKGKKGKKATSRKRTVSVGKATVSVTRAGDLSVKLPMSAKSRSALKKAKRITVKVTAIYTPTGGTARTVTRTLTLRG